MKELNTPFYLTGGTALSRGYFNHRFSDDLDFFVNQNNKFIKIVNNIYNKLIEYQDKYEFVIKEQKVVSDNFIRIFIENYDNVLLKIDFVNDSVEYTGKIEYHKKLGKIDNLLNILTNKITALYRYEPKDIADIWIICKNYKFFWKDIISISEEKEAGINEIDISNIINTFPVKLISKILWNMEIDKNNFIKELKIISEDILLKNVNSLYIKK